MTKLRAPESIEAGIQRALGILLDEGVHKATGKSPRFIRACADPDDDRQLHVRDGVALDAACLRAGAAAPILAAYRHKLHELAGDAAARRDPRDHLAAIMAEVGDVAAQVRAARDEGGAGGASLTRAEAFDLKREILDAIAALQALADDVETITKGGT